ncbi:hypothetical protein FKM82_024483 [Ascaphus truei]
MRLEDALSNTIPSRQITVTRISRYVTSGIPSESRHFRFTNFTRRSQIMIIGISIRGQPQHTTLYSPTKRQQGVKRVRDRGFFLHPYLSAP